MICPHCHEPVHPANERHGHCNASYCRGRQDERDLWDYEPHEGHHSLTDDLRRSAWHKGRLAVIRAEVERAVTEWQKDRGDYEKALSRCEFLSGSHATWTREIRLLDRYLSTCRRWLEATR